MTFSRKAGIRFCNKPNPICFLLRKNRSEVTLVVFPAIRDIFADQPPDLRVIGGE
jgi:hypothetical protein